MAHAGRSRRQLDFVAAAPLDVLIERFPNEWEVVGEQLVTATATRRPEAIEGFVRAAQEAAVPYRRRLQEGRKNPQVLAAALPYLVRSRMALLAAQRTLQTAALGGTSGRRRFALWSGFLVQRLFFASGLERKPVSMRAFAWLWPLVTQKRLLMPLVQPRGIYAFYSRELVNALAGIIGGRPALEIAAGDGCLSRFLAAVGTEIRPTDDQSWGQNIRYPASVEKLEATAALTRYRPAVVLCSFPPPNNAFEAKVFEVATVQTYLVITTRHRFAAGNWQAYETQGAFRMTAEPALSRLVLPPEIDPLVLVFERNPI